MFKVSRLLQNVDCFKVEKGQFRHFESMVGIMQKMGQSWADRPVSDFHVQFGRVEGMSSRKGTIVLLKDILDEAQSCMLENMLKTDSKSVKCHFNKLQYTKHQ